MSCSVHPSAQTVHNGLDQDAASLSRFSAQSSINTAADKSSSHNEGQIQIASSDHHPRVEAKAQAQADSKVCTASMGEPKLSNRGQSNCDKVSPFWETFDKMLSDAYCPHSNPSGVINMGIANNSLLEPELLSYMNSNLNLTSSDLTYGTSLFGSTRFFKALCEDYYNKEGSPFRPREKVRPAQIITGPGAGPLLDQVFGQLCDPGDAVLVSAPDYNGFDADLSVRSAVLTIPVPSTSSSRISDSHTPYTYSGTASSDFSGQKSLRGFEEKLKELNDKGVKVKAVICCNPHNPVGRCYDQEALIAYGKFCEENDLHLVFDEIYSLSVFPTSSNPSPERFRSCLSIDWSSHSINPSRIHLISSASKDFGMNGLRIGWFISQHNPSLINALKNTSKLYMLSSTSDALFSSLISNTEFFGNFIRMNRTRLSRAYELAVKWLDFHKISYVSSNAGHFMLIDLKPYVELMRSQGAITTTTTTTLSCGKVLETKKETRYLTDSESETALWARGLSHKILITPGSNYHHPDLGIFRLTFSLPREYALEGFNRLEKVLGLSPWTPPKDEEIWSPENDEVARQSLDLFESNVVVPERSGDAKGDRKRKRKDQVDHDKQSEAQVGEFPEKGHWERFEEEVMGKRKRTTTDDSTVKDHAETEMESSEEMEGSPGPGEGLEFDAQMLRDLKGMQSACGSCMC